MALEHALLISLRERPASGIELTGRFDNSIGYFWSASHQQIYRVLGRMERDGWVSSETISQEGRPPKRVYTVSDLGAIALAEWLETAIPRDPTRSEMGVKIRGAAYGNRESVIANLLTLRAEHQAYLETYEKLLERDYPDLDALSAQELDQYFLVRAGAAQERVYITWIDDYAAAHERLSQKGRS